jgi:hypothetical protein
MACMASTDRINDKLRDAGKGIPELPRIGNGFLSPFETLPEYVQDPVTKEVKKVNRPAKPEEVNGEFGVGREEFLKFVEKSWSAAVNEARVICKQDKCGCKFVNVQLYCSAAAHKILKLADLEDLCNRRIKVPCEEKSNADENSNYNY